ncbi:MAG: hypothetical protein HKP25_04400 [Marinicaulis sp.]|nr:hypothetical protein [Marinicaulis sp.]NNL88288.1 hypothetical protein [Marinicaulis sp.]
MASSAAIGLSFFASPALAQNDHVRHYQAHNDALERGEIAAGIEHAENAWRAAETELGDSETTAVLSYNFANLAYYHFPKRVIEPRERVIAQTGDNHEIFSAEEPKLMLLAVRSFSAKDERAPNKPLRERLESISSVSRIAISPRRS